ncbi:MAG: transcriptional regulator [Deltaproteobacteria bacterium]|nr:transcriptional regulator [Deltaproteobacteria bacterium]
MKVLKPGQPIGSSRTGRPIIVLLELLGRRWALRILWELSQNGASSFRVLQDHCGGISPTVLNARLYELREAGIIELREREGYVITKEGVKLCGVVEQLDTWARGWAKREGVPVAKCTPRKPQKITGKTKP